MKREHKVIENIRVMTRNGERKVIQTEVSFANRRYTLHAQPMVIDSWAGGVVREYDPMEGMRFELGVGRFSQKTFDGLVATAKNYPAYGEMVRRICEQCSLTLE